MKVGTWILMFFPLFSRHLKVNLGISGENKNVPYIVPKTDYGVEVFIILKNNRSGSVL